MLTLFSQIRLPILFIILLTMGMGTTITGLIIRFRPATAGGAAAIVLAPDSLIVSVKEIEATTNHDVKAIEYILKEKMEFFLGRYMASPWLSAPL